jgi:parallel beta-helix repeat protein
MTGLKIRRMPSRRYQLLMTVSAVFALLVQPLISLDLPNAFASTSNITQLAFTNAPVSVGQGQVSSQLTVQTRNASNTSESLDTGSTQLRLTSSSLTGEFSSNGTSGWTNAPNFAMNSGTANRNFYYRDTTAGSPTLTATAVDGGNNPYSWTAATQSITVTPSAPVSQTLAQRVAAASAGDTIDITSDEIIPAQIIINKPLTIKSSNGSKLSTPNALNGILGIQSNNVTVDGLTFESNFDIGESQVVRGLEVSSYGNISIKNNRFLNLRQPAYINDNAQVAVTNNYTDQTKGWVILSNSQVTFSGNTWGTNVLDIAIIPASTNNYSDTQVVALSDANNDAVVENQFGGTKRLSDAYVAPAVNGRSGDEGSKWNPYASIQSGVGRVVVGGTIHVAEGTYTQATEVNKQVILKAQSHGTRVIGGPSYNSAAFRVSAPGVVIDGFSVGDTATMVGTVGIDLGASAGAVIRDNIIERNQRGVSLSGASNVTIDNNIIRDNNANPENNAGIWGDGVSTITISNNQFSGASNTSINLAGSSDIGIKHNSFTSGANAAVIWNDTNVVLESNTLSGLSSTGFFITGTNGVSATGNTLVASTTGKSGFSVSTQAGVLSANIVLSKNKISGYTNGLNVTSGAVNGQVQATNNWWGNVTGPKDTASNDASTPASNTTGTGVAVNGAVNYGNWCLTDTCDDFFTLTAPTDLTPPTGAMTKDRGFPMTWKTVNGAAVYEYRTSNSQVDATTLGPIIYSDTSASSNYSISGNIVTRGNSGTPDADYYWQVRAGDGSGNWSPWSVINKVTVDTVAPTSTNDLTSLVRGTQTIRQTVSDNKQALSGKLRIWKQKTDGSLDATKFFASANVVAVDSTNVATYSLNTATQLYGDGNYTAKFTSRDAAGNESVQEKVFTVDNTAPTVTVKAGAIGSVTNKTFSNVSFSLYDAYKVDKYVLNGHTFDFTNNNWSDANFQNIKSKLVEGANNTLTLYDLAGNSTPYTFTYDSTAPAVPIHQLPVANAVQQSNDFWFDWESVEGAVSYEMQNSQNPQTDNNNSFTDVQWTGDYQKIQPTDSKARSVGASGTWYWQVRAVDAAGNKSAWTAPWKVTIDQKEPMTTSASITPSPVKSIDATTQLSLAIQDEGSVVASAQYTLYNDATDEIIKKNVALPGVYGSSTVNLAANLDIATLVSGTYRVQLHFKDAAGNQGKKTLYFVVNNDIVLTFNDVASNSATPRISGSAMWRTGGQPAVNQPVSVQIKQGDVILPVNSPVVTDANGNWSVVAPTLANGVYSILASTGGGSVEELTPITINVIQPTLPGIQFPSLPLQPFQPVQTIATLASNGVVPTFIGNVVGQLANAITLPSGNAVTDAADQSQILGNSVTEPTAEAAQEVKGAADEKPANWFANSLQYWWVLLAILAAGLAWWALAARRRRNQEA